MRVGWGGVGRGRGALQLTSPINGILVQFWPLSGSVREWAFIVRNVLVLFSMSFVRILLVQLFSSRKYLA